MNNSLTSTILSPDKFSKNHGDRTKSVTEMGRDIKIKFNHTLNHFGLNSESESIRKAILRVNALN